MSLIPIAFEPSAELDEIRSKLIKAKLNLNDRVVLALNLGSFWKDAIRYFSDIYNAGSIFRNVRQCLTYL